LIFGFFLGKKNPKISEYIARPLIRFGIPLSVMGLLLKEGIDINLIKSAFLAFSIIGFLIVLINICPIFKKRLPNYTLQLAGLIGNTSFLGIPIAMALLPSKTINFTIGFDLGTTLFAWIFGPFFLKEKSLDNNIPHIKGLLNALVNSPASRGIIGVLLAYIFQIDEVLGNFLWIPARIVIALAIIIVGTRLGLITNQKGKFFDLDEEIKFSILLKLFILPFVIFLVSKLLDFDFNQSAAVILQAGTPTAISTILMAEAYRIKQKIASKILFTTTLISIVTIPLLKVFINIFNQMNIFL
jgi:predicted permease